MSAPDSLLGLPLELALEELSRRGVTGVEVRRALAPRRDGTAGEWRVVRVRDGDPPVLDACCFEWTPER